MSQSYNFEQKVLLMVTFFACDLKAHHSNKWFLCVNMYIYIHTGAAQSISYPVVSNLLGIFAPGTFRDAGSFLANIIGVPATPRSGSCAINRLIVDSFNEVFGVVAAGVVVAITVDEAGVVVVVVVLTNSLACCWS